MLSVAPARLAWGGTHRHSVARGNVSLVQRRTVCVPVSVNASSIVRSCRNGLVVVPGVILGPECARRFVILCWEDRVGRKVAHEIRAAEDAVRDEVQESRHDAALGSRIARRAPESAELRDGRWVRSRVSAVRRICSDCRLQLQTLEIGTDGIWAPFIPLIAILALCASPLRGALLQSARARRSPWPRCLTRS
jgi:hypothetical protein